MRRHTHYSTEFRAEAVRLAETSGQSIRQVAMDLGISNESLARGSPCPTSGRLGRRSRPTSGPSSRSCAGGSRSSRPSARSCEKQPPSSLRRPSGPGDPVPLRRAGEGEVSGADPLRGRSVSPRAATTPGGHAVPPPGSASDAALAEQIRQFHARSRGTYGVPRIWADLAEAGHPRLAQAGRAAHEARPPRGRPPAPVRAHDDPRRARRAVPRSRQPRLHGHRARPALGRRHHAAPDARAALLPRRDHRRLHPPGRRLEHGHPHAGRARHGGSRRGGRPPPSGPASSTTPTTAPSTRASRSGSACASRGSRRPWARSATATTTRWPRASSPPSRPS